MKTKIYLTWKDQSLKNIINFPLIAERISKKRTIVTDIWTPEFISKISEDYVWKINTQTGFKLYTSEDIFKDFIVFNKSNQRKIK